MGEGTVCRIGLLPIHPEFSRQILSGSKKVEFRKRAPALDINTILIYETAPTSSIVGLFEIQRRDIAPPQVLWGKYETVGGIRKEDFDSYYSGVEEAAGLIIGEVITFAKPIGLSQIWPKASAPQSYVYLEGSALIDLLPFHDKIKEYPLYENLVHA